MANARRDPQIFLKRINGLGLGLVAMKDLTLIVCVSWIKTVLWRRAHQKKFLKRLPIWQWKTWPSVILCWLN